MKPVLLSGMVALPLWFAGAQPPPTVPAPPLIASVELRDVRGRVVGEAELREDPAGVVTLRIQLQGFQEAVPGEHGLHLHAVGACTPTFATAGGHFNPSSRPHGYLNRDGHHAGDLPNLRVDADGNATLQVRTSQVTLSEGAHSLFDADGAALVLHTGPDDYLTDPAGASGDRIACGVLTRVPWRAVVRQSDPIAASFF
ncbi:superoxide dismutase family protein [Deinococcus aerophilus]|uniref:Superoxide dismutase copper/zinc binding domain-containing protein n=1 Tax=Deinococcus aerophilus TaxID=522488 RepID=A0ABQ2GYC9_9DEIO|nr:superoxide dismutase family protein [Deinococcus aerophilus]GGM18218.1 hypothetical protein GCM10010841_27960 [Deinococcus aerophilus]